MTTPSQVPAPDPVLLSMIEHGKRDARTWAASVGLEAYLSGTLFSPTALGAGASTPPQKGGGGGPKPQRAKTWAASVGLEAYLSGTLFTPIGAEASAPSQEGVGPARAHRKTGRSGVTLEAPTKKFKFWSSAHHQEAWPHPCF